MRPVIARSARALRSAQQWTVAQLALGALAALRTLPPDRALDFVDKSARRVGPLLGRHRVALDNLRQAYPEKSEAEITAIALDMWGNMARLSAEYIFLDQLFDYVPGVKTDGRIEVSGEPTFSGWRPKPTGPTSCSPAISAISSCCRSPLRRSGCR